MGHGVSGPLRVVGPATDEPDGGAHDSRSLAGVERCRAAPWLYPARRAGVFACASKLLAADECQEPGARTEQNGPTHECENMLGRDDRGGSSLARLRGAAVDHRVCPR